MWLNSLICFLCVLPVALSERSALHYDEVRSLSELPLDKLIHIKSSLGTNYEIDKWDDTKVSSRKLSMNLPIALPLKRSSKKPIRRHEDHYEEKGGDTKISKIFQLAVTTLSFLAFGGYLLTLIITAIRRNNNNAGNGTGNVIVFSNLQKYKRPKRNVYIYDPMDNDFATERLYQGMLMLSRGYAQYN